MTKRKEGADKYRANHTTDRGRQIALLVKALKYGKPKSYAELVEITGLATSTVGNYIRAFRQAKVVFIRDWLLDSLDRPLIPGFHMNGNEDIPLPDTREARNAYHRRWRKDKKARVNSIFQAAERMKDDTVLERPNRTE